MVNEALPVCIGPCIDQIGDVRHSLNSNIL